MSKLEVIPAMQNYRANSLCSKEEYENLYRQSIESPESFWAEQAKSLHWFEDFKNTKLAKFEGDHKFSWFSQGKLNVSYNCLDRHLASKGDQVAILWEPDSPSDEARQFTFQQLHEEVCQFANVLEKNGVKKGDRVTIYLPMIPEAAFAMLACTRIGAIHSVVFAGFSPDALSGRIEDCKSNFLITSDEGRRAGKTIPLKKNVDDAAKNSPSLKKVLVVKHTGAKIDWFSDRDLWYHLEKEQVGSSHQAASMDAEDPLFILYTSGSTGKPKGVLHSTAGYLLYASLTHKYVFDYQQGDVYWCTADVGWVTGHSYIVYGPLANGATTLMFEGTPTYPDASRHWQIIDKYKVNTYYTAPTAIRALMAKGTRYLESSSRASLRLLGSVGEPINPEAWLWYFNEVGKKKCPIVDTWWQTETGGIMITPLPSCRDLKPGSATKPFFGIEPLLVDEKGNVLEGVASGNLVIKNPWPGQMRSIYGDHNRFIETYFKTYPGYYFTGDGCTRDEDGYYWITGRVDDVINVSGHRLGTAEIESSLVAHKDVSEAAVVGYPHDIKGQGIYAYIVLNEASSIEHSNEEELKLWVRKDIGAIACPDSIHIVPGLPKTRSGKIMRRILRKIAENDFTNLGDITTLAEPQVVEQIIKSRKQS